MIDFRLNAAAPVALLFAPLALSVAAIAALVAFPGSGTVWQLGAWSLVLAAVVQILVLPVAAYSMIRNASTRTWPRTLAVVLGVLYLAVLASGALPSG